MIEPEEALLYAVTHFHRAIAFTNLNSVHDFPEIAEAHLRYADSDIKVIYGAEMRYVDKAGKIPKGITILAKNQWGIKELYKIISSISTVGDSNFVSLDVVRQNRKNLLIGSCADGNIVL